METPTHPCMSVFWGGMADVVDALLTNQIPGFALYEPKPTYDALVALLRRIDAALGEMTPVCEWDSELYSTPGLYESVTALMSGFDVDMGDVAYKPNHVGTGWPGPSAETGTPLRLEELRGRVRNALNSN